MIKTVGEFIRVISLVSDSTDISFGTSKYSKRPLVFSRCKTRGDNIEQIELNELIDPNDQMEFENRKKAGYFKEYYADIPDDCQLVFSCTHDGKELKLDSYDLALVMNFQQ